MRIRTFQASTDLVPADFIHCGLDHITASHVLFQSSASHFDAAGYLAHMGVELLLKGWLLQVAGQFKGVHTLHTLYRTLQDGHGAPALEGEDARILEVLDQYVELRYPSRAAVVN